MVILLQLGCCTITVQMRVLEMLPESRKFSRGIQHYLHVTPSWVFYNYDSSFRILHYIPFSLCPFLPTGEHGSDALDGVVEWRSI